MSPARGFGLALVLAPLLAACGGGSVNGISGSSGGGSGSGSNVLPISVNFGVFGAGNNAYINGAFTTVTVCVPGTSTCQNVSNILVDTGSYGLRILSPALTLGLPVQTNSGGSLIGECGIFADGYTWGPVATADIHLAGEVASSVPIQIIGSSSFPAPPSACSSQTTGGEEDTVESFGSSGVLGIGVFGPDCGEDCVNTFDNPGIYFACQASGSSCSVTTESLASQVQNPVPLFAGDNNGVIVELPAVPAGGETTVSGSLVFGIGTESNNGLGSAAPLTLDDEGNFTTSFNGSSIPGFMDSGSNAYFFSDNIPTCNDASFFYCPSSTMNLSAQMISIGNSVTVTVPFSIANADDLNQNDAAFNNLGGPTGTSLDGFFDWGLPFFYGRNVYFAIQGENTPAGEGPYNAFSSN